MTPEQTDRLDRWRIKGDIQLEERGAHSRYRELNVQSLVGRIVDSIAVFRDGKCDAEHAFHMIEAQCTRLRMIDEELGHEQAYPLKPGYRYEN